MNNIADNIDKVMQQIAISVKNTPYSSTKPLLLAVSKGQSTDSIRIAHKHGLRSFGENYLNEAREKIIALNDLSDINWHFLGPLQSNKTRVIAENFDWVHSVDRLKIAQRLSAQRPAKLAPLNICLQINIDHDPNKSGVIPEQAPDLATAIAQLPHLKLRGLMTIPRQSHEDSSEAFKALRHLMKELQTTHTSLQNLDTLSMGMSGDFESAVTEGATIIRIGTQIFGARNSQQTKSTN